MLIDLSNALGGYFYDVFVVHLDWWLAHLTNYGSLFLGEETNVAFGDKAPRVVETGLARAGEASHIFGELKRHGIHRCLLLCVPHRSAFIGHCHA